MLDVQRSGKGFEQRLDFVVAEYICGDMLQQQVIGEIQDEDCAHPVIGKALPHLGREQERQAAGVAEKLRCVVARRVCRGHSPELPVLDGGQHARSG